MGRHLSLRISKPSLSSSSCARRSSCFSFFRGSGMAHNMHTGQPGPSNGVSATPPPPSQYTNSGGSYGGPPPGAYYDQYGQPVAAQPVPLPPGYGPPTGAPAYGPPPVAYSQPQFYQPYPQYPPQQQAYYYQSAPPTGAAPPPPPAQGGYYGATTSVTSQNHSGEFATPYPYPPPQMHHMQQQQPQQQQQHGYLQPGQGYPTYGAQPQAQQMYAHPGYQSQAQQPQQQAHTMPYPMYVVPGNVGQGSMGAAAQAFARADEGNKGHLDVKGFRLALESLGVNIQYEQVLKYFALADRDEDGCIVEREFISLYQNEICRM